MVDFVSDCVYILHNVALKKPIGRIYLWTKLIEQFSPVSSLQSVTFMNYNTCTTSQFKAVSSLYVKPNGINLRCWISTTNTGEPCGSDETVCRQLVCLWRWVGLGLFLMFTATSTLTAKVTKASITTHVISTVPQFLIIAFTVWAKFNSKCFVTILVIVWVSPFLFGLFKRFKTLAWFSHKN